MNANDAHDLAPAQDLGHEIFDKVRELPDISPTEAIVALMVAMADVILNVECPDCRAKQARGVPKIMKGMLERTLVEAEIGKERTCDVHRLVADAFVPGPYNRPQVNHIDLIEHNNAASRGQARRNRCPAATCARSSH